MANSSNRPPPNPSVDAVIEVVSRYMSRLNYRDRAAYLREQEIPRFLYKFRAAPVDSNSVRPIRDIIVKSSLWLSSPADFNDPFDAKAKVIVDSTPLERRQRFDEIFKRQGLTWTQRQQLLPRLVAKPIREVAEIAEAKFLEQSQATGVCSFGGDPLNILMWSHYPSNHHGVCFSSTSPKIQRNFFSACQLNTATNIHS